MPETAKNTDNIEQSVIEVGQHLRDGTIFLSVDLEKNEALFLPGTIFGGLSKVDMEGVVIDFVNNYALYSHVDWRGISDEEGTLLAREWAKVAPLQLQGLYAPWFWIPSLGNSLTPHGRVRKGGEVLWRDGIRGHSYPVPVIRSGPACDLDI